MIQIYLAASEAAFLALPIFVTLMRIFNPRWFGAWTAIFSVALLGWSLANLCIYFSFEDACQTLIAYGDNPPQNITKNCTGDGAARVFGVLLGGVYALVYYAPFALVYEIARLARRIYGKRRANI